MDKQQYDYETGGKQAAEANAKGLNTRLETAKNTQVRTSAAGLGDLARKVNAGKAKPMPKQSDFGGDTRAFGEALRQYRIDMDNDPENMAQKKALSQ